MRCLQMCSIGSHCHKRAGVDDRLAASVASTEKFAVFIVAAFEMPLYLPSAQPIGRGDTLQQGHSMKVDSRVKYPRFYCCG